MFHADHIGSLLRPPALLDARVRSLDEGVSADELKQLEDEAILQALEMQKAAGVAIFSDGEYRRTYYSGALESAIDGIVDDEAPMVQHDGLWQGEHAAEAAESGQKLRIGAQKVVGKLTGRGRVTKHEADFLREHSPGPFKITLTGPTQYAFQWFRPDATDVYPTLLHMLPDIAAIERDEVAALVSEGVDYIQLDSLMYVAAIGDDPDGAFLSAMVTADNEVLAPAREAGVTTALHMCRGNHRSAHGAGVTYEDHVEKAFSTLQVDRLLLEYDTERAGGFEALRFVPDTTTVVLGLISTKVPELESPDDLKRRIEEASQYVDIERLALSPQCGFASTLEGNLISWDDQRRKLELTASVAAEVWG